MRNHCYENEFDLHENETACTTHFHMKGFARRFVLKQRHKRTRKWAIEFWAKNIKEAFKKTLLVALNKERKCDFLFVERGFLAANREVKHDVHGRRQTAKITSDFLFFSCNP